MDNILLAGMIGIFGMMLYFYFQKCDISKEEYRRVLKARRDKLSWKIADAKTSQTTDKSGKAIIAQWILEFEEEIRKIDIELNKLDENNK